MRLSLLTLTALLIGTNACYVRCSNGQTYAVGYRDTVCPGQQSYIFSAQGYADVVFFDGGKGNSCVDSEGFSLQSVSQNVIGCANGVKGRCCGKNRC